MKGIQNVANAYSWLKRNGWLLDVDECLTMIDDILKDISKLARGNSLSTMGVFEHESKFKREVIKRLVNWRSKFTYSVLIKKLIRLKEYIRIRENISN